MAVLSLYEVKTVTGEMVTDGATLKEIAETLHLPIGTVRNAVYQEYALQSKYIIKKVDESIARARDQRLLIDYELTRNKILKYIKAALARKERYEVNSKRQ